MATTRKKAASTTPAASAAPAFGPPGPYAVRPLVSGAWPFFGACQAQSVLRVAKAVDGFEGLPLVELDFSGQPPEWCACLVTEPAAGWALPVYLTYAWAAGGNGGHHPAVQGLIIAPPQQGAAAAGDVVAWVDSWNHLRTGTVQQPGRGALEVVMHPTTTRRQADDPGVAQHTPVKVPQHEVLCLVRNGAVLP
ncbi:MAG: hypothetical protein QM767_22035 [Anaeromyxobacter sp.]